MGGVLRQNWAEEPWLRVLQTGARQLPGQAAYARKRNLGRGGPGVGPDNHITIRPRVPGDPGRPGRGP